jgi:hypothetical protein
MEPARAERHGEALHRAGQLAADVLRCAYEIICANAWADGNVTALDAAGRDTRDPLNPANVAFSVGAAIIRARRDLALDWRAGCAAQACISFAAQSLFGGPRGTVAAINRMKELDAGDVEILFLRAIWRAQNLDTWPSCELERFG